MVQNSTKRTPAAGMPGNTRNVFMRTERDMEATDALQGGEIVERYSDGSYEGVRRITNVANFYGVVLRRTYAPIANFSDVANTDEEVNIIYKGEVYVVASVAVTSGDPVYITPTFELTNTDGGGANTLLQGVVFIDTTTAAGDFARIDIEGDAR